MTARRDFLAFTAGAVAAKTVLPLAARAEVRHGAAPSVHPDAVLLANAAEARRLDREAFAMTIDLNHGDPERDTTYAAANVMMTAYHAIAATICMMPANTVEGILAKVELARERILLDAHDQPDPEDAMAWSLFADLERMFGGRAVA